MELIPKPNGNFAGGGGTWRRPARLALSNSGFAPWCVEAYRQRTGVQFDAAAPDTLRLCRDETLLSEGFRLEITAGGVTVAAAGEAGVVWALTRLYQMEPEIPQGALCDAPRFRHRGLCFDSARHFFAVEELEKIIEEMALVHMNVFHWHLTDDQGWRIETAFAPRLNEVSPEYYTKADIRRVVEFARLRGVEVVPEVDMPGHVTAVLAACPELSCTGQPVRVTGRPGVYPLILCGGKDGVMTFVEQLFDEIGPLFPSKRFHLGGDEAPKDYWAACPHCRARMEKEGLRGPEALQADFTARAAALLKRHGKTPVCWNDLLRSGAVPGDVTLQYWSPDKADGMETFAAQGRPYIYSNVYELYFDYPHGSSSLAKVYGLTPTLAGRPCAGDAGFLGLECCIWQEQIHTVQTLEEHLFPRIFALAEVAWCGEGADYPAFRRRLQAHLARRPQLAVLPPARWDPAPDDAKAEADAFLRAMQAGQ